MHVVCASCLEGPLKVSLLRHVLLDHELMLRNSRTLRRFHEFRTNWESAQIENKTSAEERKQKRVLDMLGMREMR